MWNYQDIVSHLRATCFVSADPRCNELNDKRTVVINNNAGK